MPNTDPNITAQIETFTQQLVATVEAAVAQRIQAALAGAFGIPQKRGAGRPRKQAVAHVAPVAARKTQIVGPAVAMAARKKQLCPVPGCKNPAAPIFGMLCKEHRNVAKSKIKKYREQRREGNVTQTTAAKRWQRRRSSPTAFSRFQHPPRRRLQRAWPLWRSKRHPGLQRG